MSNEFKKQLGNNMSKTMMGYYIDSLFKIEKNIFDAKFNKIGITFSQFKVLNWLWRYEELTQKEIHNFVQIKPSSLTNLINILIKKDLVERHLDTEDARIRKIRLTNKSRELESQAWEIVNEFDKSIKNVLTQDEYDATMNGLIKLSDHLNIDK